MADISTIAPTTGRRLARPWPGFSGFAIGASFVAMGRLIGSAFSMAYVEPYSGLSGRRAPVAEDDLGDRDPGW